MAELLVGGANQPAILSYGMLTTLVSTAALALRFDDPAYVIVDCRFRLDDPDLGEKMYIDAHIPRAVYAHLDRDLSGPKTGTNGRHPLPEITTLAGTFGRLGVQEGVQVVAYDEDNGAFASRLWWMLRWLGHDAVAVLDGGFARWSAENRPVSSGVETQRPATFVPRPRPEMLVDVKTLADVVTGGGRTLVDARAPERFRGELEPLDRVAGHIPGARNAFYQDNLTNDGTFRRPQDLRDRFRRVLADAAVEQAVCYCGSGVTACHNLLALEHAGLKGAKLYAGSWSEWSSDERRPVETGEAVRTR
jgi:thiosulfate/3-mercaptopyruvate sulfurtransferase